MNARRVPISVPLVAMIMTFNGFSQPLTKEELRDPAWLSEMVAKRIVYRVPGMEHVRIRKDVTYKRVGATELRMDVYSPSDPKAAAKVPAVIFVHGGYLPPNLLTQPKEWGVFTSYGQLIAASGLIGVTFNHRLYSSWNSLPDAQSDLADLITYVRTNSESLGIDRDRITLWVFSGGGPMLSLVMREPRTYIRCLVSYYALLDLQRIGKENPDSTRGMSDDNLRDFSPLYQLGVSGKAIAPIFIARAGHDHPGMNDVVDRFIQLALEKNLTIDVSNHPDGHHGFDIEDDNARSREIIRRTVDFIRAHN